MGYKTQIEGAVAQSTVAAAEVLGEVQFWVSSVDRAEGFVTVKDV